MSSPVTETGVRLLAAQKPVKRQGWWKGKFALFWMPATGGGRGWTSVQRPTPSPPNDNQGARAFIDRGRGATCRNSTGSSDSHLEIGHWWSDQRPLDCFNYNYSLIPGSVCSHFLEANSWNCGSFCHGYSLVIM